VIGTLVVLQNLLADLRAIDFSASLGVAGGNHVLATEELLFSVDDTGASLPCLGAEIAELSTARAG
jgi:hypothetical protein